jgi:hypothetical protein
LRAGYLYVRGGNEPMKLTTTPVRRRLLALALTATATTLSTGAPMAVADGGCANEAARTGLSANLPDCRAYEQVSPTDKGGFDINFYGANRASDSGNAFEYESNGTFAGAAGAAHADDYLATRTGTGWSSVALTPRQDPNYWAPYVTVHYFFDFTADLSTGIFLNANPPGQGESGTTIKSLYRRNPDGTFNLITPAPATNPGVFYQPTYAGSSADMSHVFFESSLPLTHEAPSGVPNLYEWDNGSVRLVDFLPGGEAAPTGATAVVGAPAVFGGGKNADTYRGISPDGSQVVFASGSPTQLYLRTNASTTVAISNSQKTGSVGTPAPTGATFMGSASADGKTISKVFFASLDELTDDANTGHGEETIYGHGEDLYEYDVASGQLHDLSVDGNPEDTEGARVDPTWMLSSPDGSYIYFIASGVLAPGAQFNNSNMYVLHNGVTTYVAPKGGAGSVGESESTQLDLDGQRLLYSTSTPLTSDPTGGYQQMYLYDAPSDSWTCISCAAGATYTGDADFRGFLSGFGSFGAQMRNMNADGQRVFFQTPTALVPQDTNGQVDVYEWENGTAHLISTGQSPDGENFLNASASGDDVFFSSRSRILPSDEDSNVDAYDARVDGGAPRQLSPPACTGTGCQGVPPAPPIFATPPSVTFNGVGNYAPAPSTKAKPKKKPVKKTKHKHAKARHKAKSTKSSQRALRRTGR